MTQSSPEEACPICLEALAEPFRLPCGHALHAHCMLQWCLRSRDQAARSCPLCRAPAGEGSAADDVGTDIDSDDDDRALVLPLWAATLLLGFVAVVLDIGVIAAVNVVLAAAKLMTRASTSTATTTATWWTTKTWWEDPGVVAAVNVVIAAANTVIAAVNWGRLDVPPLAWNLLLQQRQQRTP